MKKTSFSKLTFLALIATFSLTAEVALARPPHQFIQTINNPDKEALKDPYFKIKSYKITEISNDEMLDLETSGSKVQGKNNLQLKIFAAPIIPNIPALPPGPISSSPAPSGDMGIFDNVIMVIDKLIAVGEKIIPIIKEGKPVVTNNPMSAISVLPRSEDKDPVIHDMGGWSIPTSRHYKIVYTNGFGTEVISFVYSVSFQHSGSTEGKGKYLAGVRASAKLIDVSWGFDLDASSQLIQISNVGTQQNVVAGATLEMTYTVKNWSRNITTSESFHVTGDGKLYKLD